MLVAVGIGNVRSIVDAARDGYAFLTKNHPNAQTDLANLLDEIGKLTEYLADASSIVTSFAFTVSETELGRQPDRFNDLLRKRQAVLARFDAQLGATRAHSSEIGMYAYQLRLEAEKNGMQNLFGLLNTGKEQAKKMSRLVQEVYANDGVLLDEFQNMAKATTLALNDVQSKLGPPGLMKAENVPAAAKLLGRYQTEFLPVQLEADDTKRELRSLVNELRFPHLATGTQGSPLST